MNVKNKKFIRQLSFKSLKASKTRNIIAIMAIALTTVLFTSLFTVGFSINDAMQEANFRQTGGYVHGTLKYLTKDQYDELKTDPLIQEHGLRRHVGMPKKAPFLKSHVEVSYSDANTAKWMYCVPVEGNLPREGTNEAPTDKKVLELLGVEPTLGNTFTITFDVDGKEVTETFVLSGWWEYDEAIVANHVLIPHSKAQEIFDKTGIGSGMSVDGLVGSWNLDMMFTNTLNIEGNIKKILNNHGYQDEEPSEKATYIRTGVNWSYTGAQFANAMDAKTAIAVVGLLLIIALTGYLIIYNVFQISVSSDIRFYGLLKTIGTTGRQLRKIILYQALILSGIGIPIGLLLGYGIGVQITPVILSQMNGVVQGTLSGRPLIFVWSAIFALLTVIVSCYKPGRIAAKVSPIEAVRHTENVTKQKKKRKSAKGASLPKMAWANLMRHRGKTVITILSLSLAILLLNLTVTFTNGFDMEKYISSKIVTDFIVSDAGYFQVGNLWSKDRALPEETVSVLEEQAGIEAGARVYGQSSWIQEFVTEEIYRSSQGSWYSEEELDRMVEMEEKNEQGLLTNRVQLYGMEAFAMDKLQVVEGDLSKLNEPGGRYIAAVYQNDDYGTTRMDSYWAKIGDKVDLRYTDEIEYYDMETGEILSGENLPEERPYSYRAKEYRDIEYEVVALVTMPHSLSYRYYGADEFIMNDQTFVQDSNTSDIMYYTCDVSEDREAEMEAYLKNLTQKDLPQLDYESKATYKAEFESFRSMFFILGSVLSFIVGLVGILNFLNAILTSILTRRHELAMLQAVGMTGKQLKTMLIWEGLYYALGSIGICVLLNIAAAPLLANILSNMFWFFTYRFTILPILSVAPIFVLLGIGLPLIIYRAVSKQSIVERLREVE